MRITAIELGLITALGAVALIAAIPAIQQEDLERRSVIPRLIGFGCDGTTSAVWATEEDDFPAGCEQIEDWDPQRWVGKN